jgi:hypothetical protein
MRNSQAEPSRRASHTTPALPDGLETWSSLVWRRQVDAGHWVIPTHPDEVAEWIRQVIVFVEDGIEAEELARHRQHGIAPTAA